MVLGKVDMKLNVLTIVSIVAIVVAIVAVFFSFFRTTQASPTATGTCLPIDKGGTGVCSETDLLDKIYPVGSIYISIDSTSPGEYLGGEWEKYEEGKMLLSSSTSRPAGQTGGSEEVSLTTAQLPSHAHTMNHGHAVNSGGVAATTTSGGSSYLVAGYTGTAYPTNMPFSIANYNGSTGSAGSGAAHNNMPPFVSVNMWVRTQ